MPGVSAPSKYGRKNLVVSVWYGEAKRNPVEAAAAAALSWDGPPQAPLSCMSWGGPGPPVCSGLPGLAGVGLGPCARSGLGSHALMSMCRSLCQGRCVT